MLSQNVNTDLSIEQRMQVFAALVAAQDSQLSVAFSRKMTATRYGLTEQQVRRIEEEGLESEWPPLG